MKAIAYDREAVVLAMTRIVSRTLDMDMTWDWPCAVAFYGIAEAYRVTGNADYMEAMRSRVDELAKLGLPKLSVNSCAMGHCLLALYEATGSDAYQQIARQMAEYLRTQVPRFGEGVLQHTVGADASFPGQAWADTLFMAALFMLRAGVLWQDDSLINDALNQYVWHIRYLQDQGTGLWYHGYDSVSGGNMSAVYWGRANAWAAYTMAKAGKVLPECYLYPQYMDLAGSLNEQLSALKKYQTDNGLWRTIVNDAESYEEVSATCGIAAAMTLKHNPLHIRYIDKALAGVLGNIQPNGRVCNVSGGTAVMRDAQGYRGITRAWPQGWGQGLALAFLAAVLESDSLNTDGAL